jgi:DNA replication and repair protein RecF
VRNLRAVDIEPSPSLNVVCGDNGQGKTSLLEALYLAATSRSFRTPRLREMIGHGASGCSVRALTTGAGAEREQHVGLDGAQRLLELDGQRIASAATYALRTPVVAFHPGELALTMGPASGRRTLLDRVALFLEPASHAAASGYRQAMRARQKLLLEGGPAGRGLDEYELLMARHGAALTAGRAAAAAALVGQAARALDELAREGWTVRMRYLPGGSQDPLAASSELAVRRTADRGRSAPSFGPHRDDLVIELSAHAVRSVGSQGQHRILTLALKMAELACISSASGADPVLLLDDVSSELDAQRNAAFFGMLERRSNQVFVTTTRPELLADFARRVGAACVLRVEAGVVARLPSPAGG